MSDAPERIWAWAYSDAWANELRWWEADRSDAVLEGDETQYVRADISEAAKAAARAEGERIGMERAAEIVTGNCWFKAAKLIRAAMDSKPPQPEYPSDADIDRSLSTARLLP